MTTFLASIPPLQSAIQIHGNKDGMRVKLEIPESEMANAIDLLTMRGVVLRVSVEVVTEKQSWQNVGKVIEE